MQEQTESEQRKEASAKDAFAAGLQNRWRGYKEARWEIEEEWLCAIRAVKGEYSPEQQQRMEEQESLSKVYIKITTTKVHAAYSRLVDMLFQNVESFWDLVPAPLTLNSSVEQLPTAP